MVLQGTFLSLKKQLVAMFGFLRFLAAPATPVRRVVGPALNQASASHPSDASGCGDDSCRELAPRDCVALALRAMGGRRRLEGLRTIRLDTIEHTALMEQSYR